MADTIRKTNTSKLSFPAPVGGTTAGLQYAAEDLMVVPDESVAAGVWCSHRIPGFFNEVEKTVTADSADINIGTRLYHHAAGVINEISVGALAVAGYAYPVYADINNTAYTAPLIASGSSAVIGVIESLA